MDLTRRWDYVIAGAGSSGAVLAARLSEDPATSVLLLESGPDFRAADAPVEMHSANPMGITDPQRFADYCWPQLLARRTAHQPARRYDRGRGAGGSSSINWQVAFRGMLEDYDLWAEQGCEGWSGAEMLPFMNALEDDRDFGDQPYHGKGGPMPVERLPIHRWGAVDLALLEAALELGYPWQKDHNAPGKGGIGTYTANRDAGRRVSAADAWLEPARGRENLTVLGNAHVDRVLLDGRRATGVRVNLDGAWHELSAAEVLICAGSTFSPGILMRSGIGPAGQLRPLGIDVVEDLPVGRSLTDHSAVGLEVKVRPEYIARQDDRIGNCIIRYSSQLAGAGDNDMLIVGLNLIGWEGEGLARGRISVITWQNFSRGELRLASADPFAMPEIDEHMLSDERDLVRLRDGAKRLFALGQHPAVQGIAQSVTLARSGDMPLEAAATPAGLDEYLLTTVSDTWHLVGTCRMGDPADARTVVDPSCRVVGIEHLRVIDGSIMPEVPRANTNMTCLLIAEVMAARLRQGERRV